MTDRKLKQIADDLRDIRHGSDDTPIGWWIFILIMALIVIVIL